jgi:hypothetical protein
MNTRPPAITEAELEKLMERLVSTGARITMVDPRVTGAQTWILATIGLTLIGVGTWGIRSISELNQTMTRVVTQNEYRDKQIARIEKIDDDQDDRAGRVERHIESVDARLVIVERRAK